MSHLGDALREFPCGPGCHDFETIGTMTEVVALADEEPPPDALSDLRLCQTCMKHGSDGVCGFCDEQCSHYDELTGPGVDAGESIVAPVCAYCHLDLINQNEASGWVCVGVVPNPPHDP